MAISSLCASKGKCLSKRDYDRGYKVGYRKGFHERKKQGLWVNPLIDSPGKSIGSDFNGDGIPDLLVGAKNGSGSAVGAGDVYIFFGSVGASFTKNLAITGSADVTFLGKAEADNLGVSVATAGDVNADGIDDVMVGAYNNDDGGANTGAVYIIFGSTTLGGTNNLKATYSPDVTVLGKVASDQLGTAVAGAGDVNGDGFDDLLMSKRAAAGDVGAIYLFYGSAGLSGTKNMGKTASADVTFVGDSGAGDRFGGRISSAGDMNGDGFDDIIVGAYTSAIETTNIGAAYVFFGASNLSGTKNITTTNSADVTIWGKGTNADYLGSSVSGAGDVNGDGYDDIMVGAPGFDISLNDNQGAVYIFFGSGVPSRNKRLAQTASADMTILGRHDGKNFGKFSIANAGDINDDGFDDIIIGANAENINGITNSGAAFIFFGSSSLSGTKDLQGDLVKPGASADVTIVGTTQVNGVQLAKRMAGIGDINVDGIPDFAIGAYKGYNPATLDNGGAVYVFFGSKSLSGTKSLSSGYAADLTFFGKTGTSNQFSYLGGRGFSGP